MPAKAQSTNTSQAQASAPAPTACPRMGETVIVRLRAEAMLFNGETGAYFEPGVDTPVTVTLTTLRRLEDGDLLLIGPVPTGV